MWLVYIFVFYCFWVVTCGVLQVLTDSYFPLFISPAVWNMIVEARKVLLSKTTWGQELARFKGRKISRGSLYIFYELDDWHFKSFFYVTAHWGFESPFFHKPCPAFPTVCSSHSSEHNKNLKILASLSSESPYNFIVFLLKHLIWDQIFSSFPFY